jgi:hypothetical protein
LTGFVVSYISIASAIRIGSFIAIAGGISFLSFHESAHVVPFVLSLARVGQSIIFNAAIISVSKLFPT